MGTVKYWQAINSAMHDAMEQDPAVCVIGEDVGAAGGPFGATVRLQERFGEARVRDTPISEAVIVGAATGAAMTGLRPVVEVMFMDFMTLAMDQLVNQAAKFTYMSAGNYNVPLTVRTLVGAGRQTGPQHSQSFEAWLAHVPGLKVMWSHTPQEAYDVLRVAIADPDPVVVVENLSLWNKRGELVREDPSLPYPGTTVVAHGADVTVCVWGSCVDRVAAAVETLPDISVETVVLRSISPLDFGPLLESVAKTGRLVVVQDAPGPCSVASEIAATVSAARHGSLRAPVTRVTAPFAPAPFTPELEQAYFPDPSRIAKAIETTVRTRQ